VLQRLTELGNSVIVIEHNLDILKNCDYLIDMGPEGGDKGGKVVAQGSPKELAREHKKTKSYTGAFLEKEFKGE
jgi:excinuclease ABC subunit A